MSEFVYNEEFEETVRELVAEAFGDNIPRTRELFEHYRKMTTGEKLKETFELTRKFNEKLAKYPVEVQKAVRNEVRLEHELSNLALAEGLARYRNRERETKGAPGNDII